MHWKKFVAKIDEKVESVFLGRFPVVLLLSALVMFKIKCKRFSSKVL